MAPLKSIGERNRISLSDMIYMFFVIMLAPIVLIWTLLKAPFSPCGRAKSWKRILADKFLFHVFTNMNRRQSRAFFGATRSHYNDFVEQNNLPQVTDELGDDARLLWVGPKNAERVMLYFHGGGFVVCMPPAALLFWHYVQKDLDKRGTATGLAVLNHTLVPDTPFPAQLAQAILAVRQILDSGVHPENIQLVGDSAGAALIHGILSHLLHPLEGIPQLTIDAPFAGIYMLSPWVRLVDDGSRSLYTNDGNGDWVNGRLLTYLGAKVMSGIPKAIVPYLEANSAPDGWLDGVDKYVTRILISAGGVEALRDDIITYANAVKKYHDKVTLVIQENGTHNDPYIDFFTQQKDLGVLTPLALEWLAKGFAKKD